MASTTHLLLSLDASELGRLADRLVQHGCRPNEADIATVAAAAKARRIKLVAVEVLADRAQPEVARLRAFGDLATALGRRPPLARRHDLGHRADRARTVADGRRHPLHRPAPSLARGEHTAGRDHLDALVGVDA